MGVDFSHGDVHFSYGNFNRFRRKLAMEIGIEADEMESFGGTRAWDEIADPMTPFMSACDCNGEIASHDCQFVADRFREIVAASPEDSTLYWKAMALRVAEAIQTAAESGERFRIG